MAIFQPTNIVPSSFAGVGGGVVDAAANVDISWQVNGNSPMTGFTLNICENTAEATLVHTQTVTLLTPFYGTDNRGNPQTYNYHPTNTTWASWGLTNGNSYKYTISQTWTLGGETQTTAQNSESVFVTRAAASLSISPSSATITSVAQTFTGTYSQADGDAVQWARWVLTDADGKTLDDTGTVYTQTLSYEYNRFFDGQSYTVTLTVQTESGAEVSDSVTFAVSYTSAIAGGEMVAVYNPDDSVSLSWQGASSAPGTPSPAEGWGTAEDGVLTLASGSSVTWDEVDGVPIDLLYQYSFSWKGVVGKTETITAPGSIPIPADKAPDKLYPGTGTAEGTATATSMTKVPKNDLTGTDTLSLPVTTSKYLDSQITYSGSPSLPEPGGVITEVFSDELNSSGFALYVYRGSDGYHSYLRWTSYFEPISVTRLSGETYNDLRSTAATDENGTTIYDNYLLAEDGVSQWHNTITVKKFTLKIRYRYYQYTGTYTPAHDGLNSISITSMDPALRASGDPFAPQIKTTVSDGDGTFNIVGVAGVSGTYPLGVKYKYAYEGTGAYQGAYSGVFDAGLEPVLWERGQLISATVLSVSPNAVGATASASVSVGSNNAYTVKFTSSAIIAPTATIRFTYNSPTTGADSYWLSSIITLPANYASGITSITTGATGGHTLTQISDRKYRLDVKDDGSGTISYHYTYDRIAYDAATPITFGAESPGVPGSIGWSAVSGPGVYLKVKFMQNGSTKYILDVPVRAWTIIVAVVWTPPFEIIRVYSWDIDGNRLNYASHTLSGSARFLPNPLTSVTLNGPQTAYWMTLCSDSKSAIAPAPKWETNPDWTRQTVLYPQFYGSLEGGTLSSGNALGLMIFREEETELVPVGYLPATVSGITDYGIRAGTQFKYISYYVTNGTYSTGMQTESFCASISKFSLIEAEKDLFVPNTYHPVRVFTFRANIDGGTYSNSNAPVLLDNFTAYPLRQPSPKNALTGTLTGLLGYFENGEYVNDTVALAKAIHSLAVTDNPLFLRDLKGNMFMVGTSGAITSTINNMTGAMPTTVSIPWVEVGDADAAMVYTIDEAE